MKERSKEEISIFRKVEAVKTQMSNSGLNYDNHNDFLNFVRLVRSGEVVVHVQ